MDFGGLPQEKNRDDTNDAPFYNRCLIHKKTLCQVNTAAIVLGTPGGLCPYCFQDKVQFLGLAYKVFHNLASAPYLHLRLHLLSCISLSGKVNGFSKLCGVTPVFRPCPLPGCPFTRMLVKSGRSFARLPRLEGISPCLGAPVSLVCLVDWELLEVRGMSESI